MYHLFQDKIDVESGRTLFKKRPHKKSEAVLLLEKDGYASDNIRVCLYVQKYDKKVKILMIYMDFFYTVIYEVP